MPLPLALGALAGKGVTSALVGASAGAAGALAFGYPYTYSMSQGYQQAQEDLSERKVALQMREYSKLASYKAFVNQGLDEIEFKNSLNQYARRTMYSTYWDLISWGYRRSFNALMDAAFRTQQVNYAFY